MSIRSSLVVVMTIFGMSTTGSADEPAPEPSPADVAIEASADMVLPVWPIDPPPLRPGLQERTVVRVRGDERTRAVYEVVRPTISVFLPDNPDAARPAVVICPGGGYELLSIDGEGYRMADRLRSEGVVAVLLKYRLPVGDAPGADEMPPPIADGVRAMRLVRAHADDWRIDPQRVGILGFSAGGHLAGTVATQFDAGDPDAADAVERFSSRPDFAALIYPVASMDSDIMHRGSHDHLIGVEAGPELERRFSTARNVTSRTPPLFLVHAANDSAVPIANSLEVVAAAEAAGVPVAFERYETGGHGFYFGSAEDGTDTWFDRYLAWMRAGGFLAGE